MEGDGQGLGQRGMTGREAFREAEHTGRRHQDVLGKGSVRPVGDVDRAVLALGGFALDTATAHPAPGGGTTHHLLADRPGVDTLAEGHDGPGPFVTGHRTRFEAPAISQLVDIRTADSAVVYGDQNLTRPRRRNGTALYGDDSRRLIDGAAMVSGRGDGDTDGDAEPDTSAKARRDRSAGRPLFFYGFSGPEQHQAPTRPIRAHAMVARTWSLAAVRSSRWCRCSHVTATAGVRLSHITQCTNTRCMRPPPCRARQ